MFCSIIGKFVQQWRVHRGLDDNFILIIVCLQGSSITELSSTNFSYVNNLFGKIINLFYCFMCI